MLCPAREAYVLFRCPDHEHHFIGLVEFWATDGDSIRERMPVIADRQICEPDFTDATVFLPTETHNGETYRDIFKRSEFVGCRGLPVRRLDIKPQSPQSTE